MKKQVTIIMYHYVRDIKNSRFPRIKALDVKLFKEQIKYLKKYYEIITMEEVIEAIYNGYILPKNAALLTFDDGYIDHFKYVFPILDEKRLQGSFFIPVRAIKNNEVLDVNKIHHIIASVNDNGIKNLIEDIYKQLDKFRFQYKLQSNDYYYKKLAVKGRFDTKEVVFIKRLLQSELEYNLRKKITSRLFERYVGIDECSFSRELYMNNDQIKCMKRNGMHIGNHGFNHFRLNTLSREEQEKEIYSSLQYLIETGIDESNWTMCYPYGAYNYDTIDILKTMGCKLALTTEVDIAQFKRYDIYQLPRLDTNDIPKHENAEPNSWTVLKQIEK